MRPACLFCARKHLAQAAVLLGEAANGYPEHVWLAIGHMAEASDELIASYPDLAREIRAARKPLETSPAGAPTHVDIMGLIRKVSRIEEEQGKAALRGTGTIAVTPDHGDQIVIGAHEKLSAFVTGLSIGDTQILLKPPERIVADVVPTGRPDVVPMAPPAEVAPTAGAPCLECHDRAVLKALAEQLERERLGTIAGAPGTGPIRLGGGAMAMRAPRGRLIILTTLSNFHPSYSLTGVVLEQAHAAALAGYRILLFVHRKADLSLLPPLPPEISIVPVVPQLSLREDVVDDQIAKDLTAAMIEWFGALTHGVEHVDIISHDLLFQSWFVTFAKAIHDLQGHLDFMKSSLRRQLRWYHMAHSSVGSRPEITAIPGVKGNGGIDARYWRHTLPRGHQLLILNYADARFFAEYYHSTDDQPLPLPGSDRVPQRIHVLRNPRDLRPFLRMGTNATYLTTRYALHLVDVFMLYPLSIERAAQKGLREVVQLLGAMKRHLGLSVRLLIAAAHANGEKAEKSIAWVKGQAFAAGLVPENVIFTHEALAPIHGGTPGGKIGPSLSDITVYGLPADDVRALWQVSNLFIFPTVSEAGPLVLMEAALAGCTLVLNASLPALADYVPRELAEWAAWGASKEAGGLSPERLPELAEIVWDRMQRDTAAVLKRRMFQQHSLEAYGQALTEMLEPAPVEADDPSGWEKGDLPPGWNEPHPETMGDLPFVEPTGEFPNDRSTLPGDQPPPDREGTPMTPEDT